MSFFDWILDKLGFFEDDDEYGFELPNFTLEGEDAKSISDAVSGESLLRRDLNVHNEVEREQYVRHICELMTGASSDVDFKKTDYTKVTDKLQDMEEIDALPRADRQELREKAKRILDFEAQEAKYKRPVSKISEAKYHEIEQIEKELPGIIRTLKENEDYQTKVRRDMNLLEGEKAGLAYDRKENKKRVTSSKSSFVICFVATLLAYMVIAALRSMFYFDIKMPIICVTGISAVCFTAIFVTYRDASESVNKLSRQINRAINLQNTAKIKYVNITNAIDYRYGKYGINSSHELEYLYEKYLEEKEARHHTENAVLQLEVLREELNVAIKRYRIKEPAQFVYNPSLLVYDEEMASRRHELVIERQRLRKGMDFEVYNLDAYKDEIENLVKQYPQYSKDILRIVEEYE